MASISAFKEKRRKVPLVRKLLQEKRKSNVPGVFQDYARSWRWTTGTCDNSDGTESSNAKALVLRSPTFAPRTFHFVTVARLCPTHHVARYDGLTHIYEPKSRCTCNCRPQKSLVLPPLPIRG